MQPARIVEEETTQYQVGLTWSGSELKFDDPEPITLADGDILILAFKGNLGNRVPGVTFVRESGEPAGPLGPFCDVVQTADRVVLKGSSGSVGTFHCKAWLSTALRGSVPPIFSSNALSIDNELARKPAKEIRVDIAPGPGGPKVTVDLDELTIHTPDSVVWNFFFTDLDPNAFEPLLYLSPDEPQPPSGPLGPFESLSVATVGEGLTSGGSLGYRLITSGNNGIKGVFHFDVGVLELTTASPQAWFSVVDPAIDNSGPPND